MRKKSSFLDIALVLFVPAAFILMVTALWWTQGLSRNVHTAIFLGFFVAVMTAGTWAEARGEQRRDEIQIAAIRFGHRWSSVPAILLIIVASLLPPFQELIVELARTFEDRASTRPPPAVSVFMLGVVAMVMLQFIAASLLRAAWMHSKARP
jgi:hypothetical protein